MTGRGGREASVSRIRVDEWQPVMARLAARWSRSNSVILVTLKKGNYTGEANVRRPKKSFVQNREEQEEMMNTFSRHEEVFFRYPR